MNMKGSDYFVRSRVLMLRVSRQICLLLAHFR